MTLDTNIQDLLLYRDALILVINKPAGIAVHKGSKREDNYIEKYFPELQFGLPNPPSLAHRLDKDTSGCLILGRHRQALIKMGKLLEQGRVEKKYLAITRAKDIDKEGIINKPLAKISDKKYHWWMQVAETGIEAITHYKILQESNGYFLIEIEPKTGRTHQLRVHLASLGIPIIGDRVYGGEENENLCLHAKQVTIPLYEKKEAITVVAETPLYFSQKLD